MHSRFQSEFSQSLASFMSDYSASGLYAPVNYLLGLSGKQIRPVLTLSVCNAEGAQISKAMPAAIAVELFHNFTLMHDDIMDNAPLRRGSETVHIKFSENASILSGDVMFSLSSRDFGANSHAINIRNSPIVSGGIYVHSSSVGRVIESP